MEVWRACRYGGGRKLWRRQEALEAAGSVDTVAEVPILEVLEVFDGVRESLTGSLKGCKGCKQRSRAKCTAIFYGGSALENV
jgi:hypothetical protein